MNAAQTNRGASTGATLVNLLLGVWVAISPFVLGFSQHVAAKWSNLAVGIALVLVALLSRWKDVLEGLAVPVCVWLFFSGFVLGFSKLAFPANNVVMALVVIAAAASGDNLHSPGVPAPNA
jgi:SPW repeat